MQHVLSKPLIPVDNPQTLVFAVIRVPFFLEPDYDESLPYIESNRERLIRKWGGKEGWERQKQQHDLKGRGIAAGIPYFNLDRFASNSMASHRLIQHVGKLYGLHVSEKLYDRLNLYYFVEGHALNDRARLAKVAAQTLSESVLGQSYLSEEQILAFLNGNEGRREIENALRVLQQLGVHGIPKFIIEGSRVVDGAAGPETFIRIFREIEKRGKVARGPLFGDVLGLSQEILMKGSHTKESMLVDLD